MTHTTHTKRVEDLRSGFFALVLQPELVGLEGALPDQMSVDSREDVDLVLDRDLESVQPASSVGTTTSARSPPCGRACRACRACRVGSPAYFCRSSAFFLLSFTCLLTSTTASVPTEPTVGVSRATTTDNERDRGTERAHLGVPKSELSLGCSESSGGVSLMRSRRSSSYRGRRCTGMIRYDVKSSFLHSGRAWASACGGER